LRSVPRLDEVRKGKLEAIEGLPPDMAHLPQGCSFYARCRFRVEKCLTEKPELMLVGDRHSAACWEWEKLGASQLKAPFEAPLNGKLDEMPATAPAMENAAVKEGV
jgi:oligopeptide/dipeptide ABC transporter ATP-binding protein